MKDERPWQGIVGKPFTPALFDAYVRQQHWTDWRPAFCVVHNTSSPTLANWHSHPGIERMRNLESFYRDPPPDGNGWSAGPHLFVADDMIWVFTPLVVRGVHSPSWNLNSLGIEMVGEYETESFDSGPGAAVAHNAVCALASLHDVLKIDTGTIHFHREDPHTDHKQCPGRHVDKAALVKRVHDALVRMRSGASIF